MTAFLNAMQQNIISEMWCSAGANETKGLLLRKYGWERKRSRKTTTGEVDDPLVEMRFGERAKANMS